MAATLLDRAPASARSAAGDDGRSRGSARLALQVVLYVVLLLVVAWRTDLRSPWTSDDGAYAIQTRLVQDGGTWAVEGRPSWGTPPEEAPSFGNSEIRDGEEYPYVKHPGWIEVLRVADTVDAPIIGLSLFCLVGAVLAAAVAGRLASDDPLLSSLAFWAVGLGPPLVWSTGLWAHAPAAGLGALISLALVRWCTRPRWWWVAVLAASAAGLVLLRSEGVLAVGAIGAVLLHHLVGQRHDRRAAGATVLAGVVVLAAAIGAKATELRLVASVAPGVQTVNPAAGGSFLSGRISGFDGTFLSFGFTSTSEAIGLVVLVLFATGAFFTLRRPSPIGRVLLVAGIVLYLVRAVGMRTDLIPSVLAAVPVALLGLLAFRWRDAGAEHRVLAVFAAVYAALVIATQYPEAGGFEWGGRFMAPALVAIVVLAVSGLPRFVEALGTAHRPVVVGAAVLLILLPVVPALVGTHGHRTRHASIARDVEATGAEVAISTAPATSLIMWRTTDHVRWTVPGRAGLRAIVARAHAAGERNLVVVGERSEAAQLEGLGYDVEIVSSSVFHLTAPE